MPAATPLVGVIIEEATPDGGRTDDIPAPLRTGTQVLLAPESLRGATAQGRAVPPEAPEDKLLRPCRTRSGKRRQCRPHGAGPGPGGGTARRRRGGPQARMVRPEGTRARVRTRSATPSVARVKIQGLGRYLRPDRGSHGRRSPSIRPTPHGALPVRGPRRQDDSDVFAGRPAQDPRPRAKNRAEFDILIFQIVNENIEADTLAARAEATAAVWGCGSAAIFRAAPAVSEHSTGSSPMRLKVV